MSCIVKHVSWSLFLLSIRPKASFETKPWKGETSQGDSALASKRAQNLFNQRAFKMVPKTPTTEVCGFLNSREHSVKPYHKEQTDHSFRCYFIDLVRDIAKKTHDYKENIATMLPSLKLVYGSVVPQEHIKDSVCRVFLHRQWAKG